MIRRLTCFFGLHWAASGLDDRAGHFDDAPKHLHSDAIGEFLLGVSNTEVMPEVFLQIL